MYQEWTPIVSLNYLDFLRHADHPVADLVKEMERIRVAVKKATGYYWDNAHWRVSDIYGREYSFQVYNRPNGCGVITLWDYTGHNAICEFALTADKAQRYEAFKTALKAAERWSNGEYQCAGCNQWFKKPCAGTIYAGQYCPTCADTDTYRRDKADEGI